MEGHSERQRPGVGRERIPDGACIDESGLLLVFLRSDQGFVQCETASDGSLRVVDDHCRPRGELRGQVFDYCEGVEGPVTIGRATIDVSERGT